MATTKNDRIYVRVNDEIKKDFEAVAAYRGLKSSTLLHSLIVRTIHEQREATPQLFTKNTVPEMGGAAPDRAEKISVNALRAKNKSKKTKETLSTGSGEIPLVDEASSASDDEQ